ncbi:MAG: helix-turn-helix domain-containing protein, partial [Gammaproteobacteria bacterium]
ERVGHLFQGRYKSIFVDKDSYLLELSRYIVLNPVRANLVKRPWDWKWSSYLATVGSIESPSWLSSSSILRQFGRNKEKSQKNFKRFVEEGLVTKSPWDNLHGQIWLGSENFREKMENELKGKTFDNIPVIQTMPLRPTKEDVINVVSEAYHVNHEAIFDRSVKSAYRACVYLLRRAANLSLKEVSEICGISPSRISQIQREIEANKSDKHLNGLAKKYKVKN